MTITTDVKGIIFLHKRYILSLILHSWKLLLRIFVFLFYTQSYKKERLSWWITIIILFTCLLVYLPLCCLLSKKRVFICQRQWSLKELAMCKRRRILLCAKMDNKRMVFCALMLSLIYWRRFDKFFVPNSFLMRTLTIAAGINGCEMRNNGFRVDEIDETWFLIFEKNVGECLRLQCIT